MCKNIAKCVLISINTAVFLIGLALAVIGALLEWGQGIMNSAFTKKLSELISGGTGPNGEITFNNLSVLVGEYMKYLGAAGLVIFIFGLCIMLIAFFGLCGACKASKCLLVLYIALVGIVLVGMIVLTCLIAFKKNDVRDEGRKYLLKYLKERFVGLNAGNNADSAIMSLVMARLSCCGVDNSSDFSSVKTPKWNTTYKLNGTVINLQIPLACCKMQKGSYKPQDDSCLTDPTPDNSNMETGCYAKLWDIVDTYSTYTNYVLIATCVLLFILIVCAVVVIRSVKSDDIV